MSPADFAGDATQLEELKKCQAAGATLRCALNSALAFFFAVSASIRSMARTSARSVLECGFQSGFSMPIKVDSGRSAFAASAVLVITAEATKR